MPSQVALLLCTAFVLLLLREERRQSSGASAAVWIPTLWMMAIAAKPLSIWFGVAGDAESGSMLDRLVLVGLGTAGALVLARRRFDWSAALLAHGWLLVLLGFMLVSTIWSDITLIALRRWIRVAVVPVMALVLMSETDPRRALESALRRSACILIPFSLVLIKYYPALGREYARWSGEEMWIGVTVHKNTLGRLCLISAFFLLWTLYRRWSSPKSPEPRCPWWPDASVLLISLFLLKGAENAYSATSVGTLMVGIVTLLGLHAFRKLRLPSLHFALLASALFLICFGAAAPFLGGENLSTFSVAFGRNETLTGRTETWTELVPVVKRQPLLGYGFGSFWTTERREFYQMSYGHNGYLDILLELGTVGLALYVAWLLSCIWKLRKALAHDHDWGSLALSFVFMAIVYNYTESALSSLHEQMTAVLVAASMVVPYDQTRVSRRSHFDLRLHLPAQRAIGATDPHSRAPENWWPIRVLSRGSRQRPWRARPRNRQQGS